MRWKTRWLPLAILLLVGCDSNPVGPDDATLAATISRSEPVIAPSFEIRRPDAPRWLQIRGDGLYDDQGVRRLSAERVHSLGIDKAFELHRKAKLEWLKEREKKASTGTTSAGQLIRLSTNATREAIRPGSPTAARVLRPASRTLTVPTSVSRAVAADDPCFFDATIWCTDEYGGELGGGAAGGGTGTGPSTSPSDYSSTDCSFIRSSMNNAYAAYARAQAVYMEMVGSVTDAPFSNGVIEGALQAQYSKMQSYLADYNTWKNLATKYHC